MAKGDFRKRTRLSQLAVEEKNRLKRGPSKYITKGRGKRVLNPKWTAWNKKKTDASDLKIRLKENEEEQRKYIREEKPDGTPTVRERTAVDSMDDIKKYSENKTEPGRYKDETLEDYNKRRNQGIYDYKGDTKPSDVAKYSGKDKSWNYERAVKNLKKEGRNQQKTDVNQKSNKLKIKGKDKIPMVGNKKATAIQQKLLKSGFSADELLALQRKHKKWLTKRGR